MNLFARRSTAVITILAASAVAVPAAGADDSTTSTTSTTNPCGYTGTTVFAPWNDNRNYTLTSDGGFENGATDWTLDGGSAVGEGNETFQVGGSADHQSLALPAGSSATSPAICVTKHTGVFRLFARTSADPRSKSRLKVEVLYTGVHGHKRSLRVGLLKAGDAWAPTRKLPVVLGRAKGKGKLKVANVKVRFTPVGAAADWQIDDLYIDPRLRR